MGWIATEAIPRPRPRPRPPIRHTAVDIAESSKATPTFAFAAFLSLDVRARSPSLRFSALLTVDGRVFRRSRFGLDRSRSPAPDCCRPAGRRL